MNRMLLKLAAFSSFICLLPTTVFAGTLPSVVLGPAAAAPGSNGGLAHTVPTLSDGLLIGLGLILAVVALRVIRQKNIAQKVLSFAIFASGLVVGAVGVERTMATTATSIPQEAGICAGGEPQSFEFTRGESSPTMVLNNCESQILQVVSYAGLPCPPNEWVVTDAGIGATFAPGVQVSLNHCPPPTPTPT